MCEKASFRMFLLLLLLSRNPCPDGMRIVGRCCSTPCIYAKETLDSVPNWLNLLLVFSTGSPTQESSFFVPSVTPPPILVFYLATASLMSAFSHHRIPTRDPGVLSLPSHRSRIDCVSMHCTTVFCLRQMYSSVVSKPISSLDVTTKVYSHFPSDLRCRNLPVKRRATWYYNPPRKLPIRGLTTHVSSPKSSTARTTALKKNL